LKIEFWGSPLVQEKYQGEKARNKRKWIIINNNNNNNNNSINLSASCFSVGQEISLILWKPKFQ
jgi:hypothetical protein